MTCNQQSIYQGRLDARGLSDNALHPLWGKMYYWPGEAPLPFLGCKVTLFQPYFNSFGL